jgi:hypothetical protein
MKLSYVVEEVIEIDDYSPDSVEPIGTFETVEEAVAAARAYEPAEWRKGIYVTYARIKVEGWKQ